MGQWNNNADIAVGAGASPDIQMTAGPFAVVGDIDGLTSRTRLVDRYSSRLGMRVPLKGRQAAAEKPSIKLIVRPH